MQIAAGICTYASPELLKRCLESLRGLTDLNIIIHGRFKGFPEVMSHRDSLLKTMQVAENYHNVEIISVDEDKTQMQHRNRYLEIAGREGMEWLLVIDDDDYVIRQRSEPKQVRNNLEDLRREIDSQPEMERYFLYNVAFVQDENQQIPRPTIWARPRMLYEPGYFSYLESAHYHLRDPIGRIYKGHPGHELIVGLFLRHDQDSNNQMRLPQYMDSKTQYGIWQSNNETG